MSKENPKNESKIKSKVRELAKKQGITSSYGLMKRLNVAPTVAVNLWNDDVTRFSVETLQLLCEKLMCEVGELLVYESNAKRSKPVAVPESVKGESVKVEAEKPPKRKSGSWAGKPGGSLAEILAEENSGKGWKNSVLDIVQSSSDNETLLSSVQVAERLNVSRKSVNDYIIDGKLKATKGKQNHNFVTEADLQEFIKKSQLER
jgi:DNA-binding Xre family transcriptional regulator